MKIKFGAIIVAGSGKIGGHVVSKNRGGAYMRTKVTPTNPQTSFQSTARNALTSLSQAWKGLTAAARAAWNGAVDNYIKTDIFGDGRTPSGLNLYVKLNANLNNIGEAALALPPLPAAVPPVLTQVGTAAAGAATFTIAYTTTPVPANTAYIISLSAQVSPGKKFLKGTYRQIDFADAAAASPNNIHALYIARFGALVAGQKIGISMVPINKVTGQKGQAVVSSVIVAA